MNTCSLFIFYLLTKFKKKLPSLGKRKINGRNNLGTIVVYHRGGGHKKLYRFVDFFKFIYNVKGLVLAYLYDPNRTAMLALILYSNGILAYCLAVINKKIGSFICCTTRTFSLRGDTKNFLTFESGTMVNCIEIISYCGAKLLRSGYCSGKLITKND